MAVSYSRGHKLYYDKQSKCWRYADNHKAVKHIRRCKLCKRKPTKEGFDACMGRLQGVKYACCGHGNSRHQYIIYK